MRDNGGKEIYKDLVFILGPMVALTQDSLKMGKNTDKVNIKQNKEKCLMVFGKTEKEMVKGSW